MLCVDMSQHQVVRVGLAWPHPKLPSTKEMLSRLERNEAYVSWLQPREGSVEDQFPTVRVGDTFYTLSLRMMKAIWRHVRLRRGFVNRDAGMLRIPAVLLSEKIRTQERFQVRVACACIRCSLYERASFGRSCDASRGPRSPRPRPKSATCSGSSRTP